MGCPAQCSQHEVLAFGIDMCRKEDERKAGTDDETVNVGAVVRWIVKSSGYVVLLDHPTHCGALRQFTSSGRPDPEGVGALVAAERCQLFAFIEVERVTEVLGEGLVRNWELDVGHIRGRRRLVGGVGWDRHGRRWSA